MMSRIKQFDHNNMIEYWKFNDEYFNKIDIIKDPQGLSNVCYNNAPLWFNKMIAKFQARAFEFALKNVGEVSGKEVLEIGCGTGRWVRLLTNLGGKVTGIDIQKNVIERNRTLIKNAKFIYGDFLTCELPEERFEIIISITVLQHLPYESQISAIRKIYRLLKKGGHIIILENCKDIGLHVFSNSINEWINKFSECGFKCVYTKGYGYHLLLYFLLSVQRKIASFINKREKMNELTPRDYCSHITSKGGLLKRIYWNLILRPAVYISYPLEYVFEKFPDRFAKHTCLVFQKFRH